MWWILLLAAALYILLLFVLPRYSVPFTRKLPLPSRIPRQLEHAIRQTERSAKTPYQYIAGAADYLLSTSHYSRKGLVRHLPFLFEEDINTLLDSRGFMGFNQFNHLMRLMLARSGLFSDDRIRLRTTVSNFLPHQYLQVKLVGQWYDIDVAGRSLGVPLGRHLRFLQP